MDLVKIQPEPKKKKKLKKKDSFCLDSSSPPLYI